VGETKKKSLAAARSLEIVLQRGDKKRCIGWGSVLLSEGSRQSLGVPKQRIREGKVVTRGPKHEPPRVCSIMKREWEVADNEEGQSCKECK